MRRPTHAARVLMSLLSVLVVLSAGCEDKKSDDDSPSAGNEATTEAGADEAPPAGDEAATTTTDDGGALLAAMKAAGFEPAPGVPFDDDGALPDAVANGELGGMTGSRTHVLRRAQDDAYIQLFVATFGDEAAATAARTAQPAPAPVQRGNQLVWVLTFDAQPELVEAVRGVLSAGE